MQRLGALLLAAALLSGCTSDSEPRPRAEPEELPTSVPAALQVPEDRAPSTPWQGLALVPYEAEVVTLTDFDALRARYGWPDMTSADLMTDRTYFWDRVDRSAVQLTDGLLREEHSRFWLDHDFTQDDVDWEVRFTGPEGSGYVLAFRPDLDMAKVEGALGEETLDGATVLAEEHLLVKGIADEGDPVWAADPLMPDLVEDGAESTYLHRGCLPVQQVLGVDATYEDQEALLAEVDPTTLRPLDAFAISFAGGVVTARLGPGRLDLHDRADLLEIWPSTGTIGMDDAFAGMPVGDPATGRIGMKVGNPTAAATLTLTGQLPFAVCDEVVPFEEPTGL